MIVTARRGMVAIGRFEHHPTIRFEAMPGATHVDGSHTAPFIFSATDIRTGETWLAAKKPRHRRLAGAGMR